MTNGILILAVVLAVLAVAVVVIRHLSKRGGELAQLCENGIAVVGTLTEVRKERRSRTENYHYIRYSFRSSGGIEYSRELRVSEREFANYTEGQAIDVVYLPNDPDTNALKTLVNQVRDASKPS